MNTHAEFFCFFRRRNQKSSHLQENQSPNIIELLRFTSFPTQLRQPVTVTMTLSLLLWCTFGFSSATESLNSTDTCATRHPLQGSLFLPLCLVGRSSPPGLIVIEARFSQQFFRHSCHHGFCRFHGHCHAQRPAAPTTLSLPALRYWSVGSVRRGRAHHLRQLEACLFHQSPTQDQTPVSVYIVVHLSTLVHSFAFDEDQL